MSTQTPRPEEYLFKILVVGDLGVGKTSIIKKYVHNIFSTHYKVTVGVDFALKTLRQDNMVIRLQLWDIAGQERYGSMTRVYYKEAVGAFLVFDSTRIATFEAVLRWKRDIDAKVLLEDDKPIPVVLLANKSDLSQDIQNQHKELDEFCKEHGFVNWFKTSAKDGTGIDDAARCLVAEILKHLRRPPPASASSSVLADSTSQSVKLDKNSSSDQPAQKDGCC